MITPIKFIKIWASEARRAFLERPIEAIQPVTQLPMLAPNIIAIAPGKVIE